MRVIKPPVPLSQWDQLIPKVDDSPELGFETINEIAAKTNRGVTAVRVRVKELLKAGKVEMRMFRPNIPNAQPTAHYRPTDYEVQPVPDQKHRRHR